MMQLNLLIPIPGRNWPKFGAEDSPEYFLSFKNNKNRGKVMLERKGLYITNTFANTKRKHYMEVTLAMWVGWPKKANFIAPER